MKLCDKCISGECRETCTEKDRVGCLLGEVRYEFMDGMNLPNMERSFSTTEYDIIKGVFMRLYECVEKWYD